MLTVLYASPVGRNQRSPFNAAGSSEDLRPYLVGTDLRIIEWRPVLGRPRRRWTDGEELAGDASI
jgi:hypothetical protein